MDAKWRRRKICFQYLQPSGYLILGSKMSNPDSHQQNKLNLYLEVNKINISEGKLKYAPALHRIPEDFNS